jgi:hypothetical protein
MSQRTCVRAACRTRACTRRLTCPLLPNDNSWSRERLREAVGNLIKCVAVDKTKSPVANDLLTQPVITSIDMPWGSDPP